MKISLRKANAIQSAIQEELNVLELKTDIQINEFEKPSEKIKEMQTRFFENMKKRSALLNALYEIRASVSGENGKGGINGLLTILARNEKDIVTYNKLSRLLPQVDIEIIRGKLGKLKSRSEESYYNEGSVATGIFSEENIFDFKQKLALLKKEKQALQDELLELNVRTEITASPSTVKTLVDVGIL